MKIYLNPRSHWIIIYVFIHMVSTCQGYAQSKHGVSYTAMIEIIGEPYTVKGLLYQVNDSAVVLFLGKDPLVASGSAAEYRTVRANKIQQIKLKPTGKMRRSITKGVLYGSLSGAALGGLNAAAYHDDFWFGDVTTGEWLLTGIATGAFTGAIIGAITGTIKTKILIDGSQQRFNHQRDYLTAHAYEIVDPASSPPL